jgi:hypothetical protein
MTREAANVDVHATGGQPGLFADGDTASSGQICGVNGQFEQVEKPPSLAMICPVM